MPLSRPANKIMKNITKTKILKYSASFVSILILFGAMAPLLALAQNTSITTGTPASFCPGNTNDVKGILNFFTCLLLNSIVPLLISLAIVSFIYGVIRYVLNANDSVKREEGRNFMIWGIVALFVMIAVGHIIGILERTFFGSSTSQTLPTSPSPSNPSGSGGLPETISI